MLEKGAAFSIVGQLREKIGLAPLPPGGIWAKHRPTVPPQDKLLCRIHQIGTAQPAKSSQDSHNMVFRGPTSLDGAMARVSPPTLRIVSVVAPANFTQPSYSCRNAADVGIDDWLASVASNRKISAGCNSAEPLGISKTAWVLRGPNANRHGRRLWRIAKTQPRSSRKITSTGKRTKHVWTELQGTSSRAAPEGSGRRNCSPTSRDQKPSAILNWATTVFPVVLLTKCQVLAMLEIPHADECIGKLEKPCEERAEGPHEDARHEADHQGKHPLDGQRHGKRIRPLTATIP